MMKKTLFPKLKKIPKKPGAYLFKDQTGRILYIGKARNLKKRVQTHFATLRLRSGYNNVSPFIDKVADVDWIKTDNEQQAMLLENQLIKKYQPRYNIHWRDDKSYFYVIFTPEDWPRVLVTHQRQIDKKFSIFNFQFSIPISIPPIGPFVNGRELRQTLRALRKIIPFRTCKNQYDKPCLQWHLGLCPAHRSLSEGGPADDNKSKIKNFTLSKFKNQKLKTSTINTIVSIVPKHNNYLNSLSALSQFLRLYASEPIRIEAYDISNIQGRYATGSMIVFYGNKPSKSDYRRFRIKTVPGANDIAMIKEVLTRRFGHLEWPYPDLILIDGGKAQLHAAMFITKLFRRSSKWFSKLTKPIIPVIALAKREEEIYTEYSDKPLKIARLPLSLRLTLQQIRDEAHRFANFYYRYLHRKGTKHQ